MQSPDFQRRESLFTQLTLVASLALAAVLLVLLANQPMPFFQETGRGAFSKNNESLRNSRSFPSPGGGENTLLQYGQTLFQEFTLDTIGPLLRILQTPVGAYRSISDHLHGLQQVQQENRTLKLELDRLRLLNVRNDELSFENQRLRLILDMKSPPAQRTLVARVIGNSSSAFVHSLLLNVGRDDGVLIDSTVMATGGLMGRVVRVARNTALVLTLLDLNSHIPVLVQRSRVPAIVSGRNRSTLDMAFVSKGADVRVGDLLVTSGEGDIFPKGILVGQVQTIAASEETGLFHAIQVQPAADFSRTEEVRLLLSPESDPESFTRSNFEAGKR